MLRAVVLLLIALACGPVLADTHISYVDESGRPGTQIYVHDGEVRVESPADRRIVLYDTTSQRLSLLLPKEGRYLSFDTPRPQVVASDSEPRDPGKLASDQATLSTDQIQLQQRQIQQQALQASSTDPFAATAQDTATNADLQMQIDMDQNAVTQDNLEDMGNEEPTIIYPRGPEVDTRDLGRIGNVGGRFCREVMVTVDADAGPPLCIDDDPTTLGIPAPDLAALKDMRNSMRLLDSAMGPLARRMHDWMADGFVLEISLRSSCSRRCQLLRRP